MLNSISQDSDRAAPASMRPEIVELSADDANLVGGGLWPLVIGIAIGCALLLAHD